jgi:replicative DNA helicase
VGLREELAVVGHALINQDHCEHLMAEFTDEHFVNKEIQFLFRLMQEIVSSGRRPKYGEIIANHTHLIGVAGQAWEEAKASLDADKDFESVRKEHRKRCYRKLAEHMMRLTEKDFEEEEAESLIESIIPHATQGKTDEYMVSAEKGADMALEALIEARKNPGQINGVRLSYDATGGAPVGFQSLDYTLNGLRGGDLIMIAAESGHGKTALAMNLTRIMSYHNGRSVYYLNTEMDITQMFQRWAAMATRIEYQNFERGEVTDGEMERYMEWHEKVRKSPLEVSRIPSLSPKLTKALAKRYMRKHGKLEALIVDYIGRMNHENVRNMAEYQILSAITKELKEIAMELDIPIIALAQLNAEGKLEGAKKMKNECDGLFFFRPKTTKSKNEEGETITVTSDSEYYLIKEKVRRGSTEGAIHCEFHKKYQFIREV